MDKREILRQFWNDKATMAVVQEFITDSLKDLAVEKAMNRDDTSGIADANDALNLAFDQLDDLFESKENKLNINEAR